MVCKTEQIVQLIWIGVSDLFTYTSTRSAKVSAVQNRGGSSCPDKLFFLNQRTSFCNRLLAEQEKVNGTQEKALPNMICKSLFIKLVRTFLGNRLICIANGRYLMCCQPLLEVQTGVAWNAGRGRLRCGDGFLHFLQRSWRGLSAVLVIIIVKLFLLPYLPFPLCWWMSASDKNTAYRMACRPS